MRNLDAFQYQQDKETRDRERGAEEETAWPA